MEKNQVWDEIDFFIIKKIYQSAVNKSEITTWQIAKEFDWFDKNCNCTDKKLLDKFYTGKIHVIQYHLKKMSECGIVKISKNGYHNFDYILDGKKVLLCKHKFPSGYRNSIQILGDDSKWSIFQL